MLVHVGEDIGVCGTGWDKFSSCTLVNFNLELRIVVSPPTFSESFPVFDWFCLLYLFCLNRNYKFIIVIFV